MQDFEFTIEEGKLYMLQTRNGKRTGPAAVRVAVDMVTEGLITKKEAVHAGGAESAGSVAAPGAGSIDCAKTLQKIANRFTGIAWRSGGTCSVLIGRCGGLWRRPVR